MSHSEFGISDLGLRGRSSIICWVKMGSNYLGLPPDGNEKSSQVIHFETFKVSSSDLVRR